MGAVSFTLDGRPATAGEGETILAAATRAGVAIPTLCRMPGYPPPATCGVCAVEVAGRPTLAYACAARVEPGMAVLTGTERVLAARRTVVELLLSEHPDDCVAPCRRACVARCDVPGMVDALAAGDPARADGVLRGRLRDPKALGRSCPAPCAAACRADPPLPLKALHQAAAGEPPPGVDAAAEAGRCLGCGCAAVDRCVLKKLADVTGASWSAYGRPPEAWPPARDASHPDFVHEPAKCVKCGRCAAVAARHGAKAGLGFVGRGFGLRVAGPLDASARETLAEAGGACVDACPTGALYRKRP